MANEPAEPTGIFHVTVEEDPKLEFSVVGYPPGMIPDILVLPDGTQVMIVSKYLSPGDRFRGRRPTVYQLDEKSFVRD